MIAAPGPQATPLQALREDLRLMPGTRTVTGSPTWLIFDPIAHRYFQIDVEAYQLLSLWSAAGTADDLQAAVFHTHGHRVELDDIAALGRFLEGSGLFVEMTGGWRSYAKRAAAHKPGWLMWLLHNYLFIRIPLLRPARFLAATLPLVAPFYSRTFGVFVLVTTLVGLYLTSRQWNEFIATFQHFFSLGGAAFYIAALAVVKALHELGHAYTATRFGCRVPTMGVALLVMMPMLYTDVTDAWKLTSRRQRMLIDAAGIIVELALAGLATFAWSFLPDSPARSIAFVIATTSWIMSLVVNLSPLMRFDGYFLFADWVGISNLQPRANALGRWQLRALLFGISEPCPDTLPPRTRAWVIAYAWAIWLYRLVVFTGIALTVYHLFFKVLGIVLFLVEILWFIAKPIACEIQEWWSRRRRIAASRHARVTLVLAAAGVAILTVPWSTKVTVPAVIEPAQYIRIHPMASAHVKQVHAVAGQEVAAGQLLMEMESPKLEQQLVLTDIKIALQRARLARRGADKKDRADTMAIESELAKLLEKHDGLTLEMSELEVRAPFAGRLVDLNPELHAGRWISRKDEIAVLVAPTGVVGRGYLHHEDLGRIAPGAEGWITFDYPTLASEPVRIDTIAYAGSTTIDIPYLASTFGGPVAVREEKDRGPVPNEGAYLVTLSAPLHGGALDHVLRGVAHIEGRPESLLAGIWRQVLRVLVRESGA